MVAVVEARTLVDTVGGVDGGRPGGRPVRPVAELATASQSTPLLL
jgi:hypothetical protein